MSPKSEHSSGSSVMRGTTELRGLYSIVPVSIARYFAANFDGSIPAESALSSGGRLLLLM